MTGDWTLVSLDAVAPQPWRNGGGSTRELLAWPSPQRWTVRISVADVTRAGPFSRFAGVERWFAVLEGRGVELRMPDGLHVLASTSPPLRFDGGVDVDCSLVDGPTRDLNLMAPPGAAHLRRIGPHGHASHAGAGSLVALYAHRHAATVVEGVHPVHVPPYHLAWCLRRAPLPATAQGEDAFWMEVTP
ncbi:MAG TPA: HutD family protein [Ramlibacter sp.]|nr:HutD family protein [Ramlibacter sp.]